MATKFSSLNVIELQHFTSIVEDFGVRNQTPTSISRKDNYSEKRKAYSLFDDRVQCKSIKGLQNGETKSFTCQLKGLVTLENYGC